MNATTSSVDVELGRGENRGFPQDRVRPAQLPVVTLQRRQPPSIYRRRPRAGAPVDLSLGHPLPQRLAADAQLLGDTGHDPEGLPRVLPDLEHHPDRPLTQLDRVLRWPTSSSTGHGSILTSKGWSLRGSQGASLAARCAPPGQSRESGDPLLHRSTSRPLGNAAPPCHAPPHDPAEAPVLQAAPSSRVRLVQRQHLRNATSAIRPPDASWVRA